MENKQGETIPRRNFFRAFLKEIIVNYHEAKGIRQVPLDRLNELPQETIKEIIPVVANNPEWEIAENQLIHHDPKADKSYLHKSFNKTELFIIQHFSKEITLHEISSKLSASKNMAHFQAYKQVTDLFFELTSLLICHPLEQYDFDAISNHQKEEK